MIGSETTSGLVDGRGATHAANCTCGGELPTIGTPLAAQAVSVGNAIFQEGEQLRRMGIGTQAAPEPPVKSPRLAIADCLLAVAGLTGSATAAPHRCPANDSALLPAAQQALSHGTMQSTTHSTTYSTSQSALLPPVSAGAAGADELRGLGGALAHPREQCIAGERGEQAKFARQHCSVIKLLQRHGYEIGTDQQPLSSSSLMKAAVDYWIKYAGSDAALASHILADRGYYGGQRGDVISDAYQSKVIHDWIALRLFGCGIDDFIAASVRGPAQDKPVNSADLATLLSHRIYTALLASDTEAIGYSKDAAIKHWIWERVVLGAVPVLQYATSEQRSPWLLAHPEWGQINAGLLFVRNAGLDASTVTVEQALALGTMLRMQLQEQLLPPEWELLFHLPVVCHAAAQERDDGGAFAPSGSLLDRYLNFCDQFQQQRLPFSALQKQLADFKTRPQLAQKKIDSGALDSDVTALLNNGAVDADYQQQVDQVAQAYREVDVLLLLAGWGQLAATEIDFIDAAVIQRRQAEFSAVDAISGTIMAANPLAQRSLTKVMDAGVELFAATHDGQERIYAVRFDGMAYQVQRVDREPRNYYSLLSDVRPRTDPDYKLKIYPLEGRFPQQQSMMTELCRTASDKHRQVFARQLHAAGYEETGRQKAIAVALSLLPFYTCVNEAVKGNAGEAALACSIDALMLLPLVGQVGSMGLRVGRAGVRGAWLGMQRVASDMAAHGSMKTALQQGGRQFVHYGMLPASQMIGRHEMAVLGMGVLRALDPGIEVLGRSGRMALRQSIILGRHMEKQFPALKQIFPRLEAAISTPRMQSTQLPATDVISARVNGKGRDHELQVARLAQEQYRGRPVYVQFDPLSGQMFGRRYQLQDDGMLKQIRIEFVSRIVHLQQQGMGARGSVMQVVTGRGKMVPRMAPCCP